MPRTTLSPFFAALRSIRPRRRWLRFHISHLLLAMALVGSWLAIVTQNAQRQLAMIRAIERTGGGVVYEHQIADPAADLYGRSQEDSEPPYLVKRLGLGYASPVHITLGQELNDAEYAAIGRCTRLRSLDAWHPQLDDARFLPWRHLTRLKSLALTQSAITDVGLAAIADMDELELLSLWGAHIDGPGLIHLADKTQLKSLILSFTNIGDSGLELLSELTGLEELFLNGTHVSDDGAWVLARMTRLRLLDLRGTDIGDEGLTQLSSLKNLEYLDLGGTRITGATLAALADMKSLRQLYLDNSQLNDQGLARLPLLPALESIGLSGTAAGNDGAINLSRMPLLGTIGMDETDLGDAGFIALSRSPGLRSLTADNTLVTDAGLEAAPLAIPLLGLIGAPLTQAGVDRYTKRLATQVRWRENTRATPIVTRTDLWRYIQDRADDSADLLWERAVVAGLASDVSVDRPGISSRTIRSRLRSSIDSLFRRTTERADQPAPIYIAWGDSGPGDDQQVAIMEAIAGPLDGHPDADLLQQVIATRNVRLLAYAAASALQPDYPVAWERIATFANDPELARRAAEAFLRLDRDNALPYFLMAVKTHADAPPEDRIAWLEAGLAASRLESYSTPLPPHVVANAATAAGLADELNALPYVAFESASERFVDGFDELCKAIASGQILECKQADLERRLALGAVRMIARIRDAAASAGSTSIVRSGLARPFLGRWLRRGSPTDERQTRLRDASNAWGAIARAYGAEAPQPALLRFKTLLPDLLAARQAVARELLEAMDQRGLVGSLDWLVDGE